MTPQTFGEILQKKLGERTNYNKDLIEEKNRLQSELISQPNQERARLRETAILDPLERERFVTDNLAVTQQGLGSITDLLNARGQALSDIINRATGQYADMYSRRGTGGGTKPTGSVSDLSELDIADLKAELLNKAAEYATIRKSEDYQPGLINTYFQDLWNMNKSYGLGFSRDYIWQLLGNSPAATVVEEPKTNTTQSTDSGGGTSFWDRIFGRGRSTNRRQVGASSGSTSLGIGR